MNCLSVLKKFSQELIKCCVCIHEKSDMTYRVGISVTNSVEAAVNDMLISITIEVVVTD